MQEERIFFNSVDAEPLRLEGVIHRRAEETAPRPAVVLCHPHPLFGGSADVPVIVSTARELARRGVIALRFDFRGVGHSEGSFGDGVAEVADVAGAVEHLVSRKDVDPGRVYLMGYSFGSSVGLRYVETDPCIGGIVALCHPLGDMSIGSLDENFWQTFTRPKLFLAGDRDHVCPLSGLRLVVESLPEPKQLIVLAGVDHFLWGREREVANHIAGFLEGLARSGRD